MMTRTWRLSTFVLCVTALTGCDGLDIVAAQAQARGTFERTLTVNGPVDLSVRTGSGDIQIRAGSGDRVQVTGRIFAREFMSGDATARVQDIEKAPPIVQNGNVIRIGETNDDTRYRNVSISYELVVPADARITSRTGSGDQSIGSLNGPVNAHTGSGDIHIERTGGSLDARTGSGDIRAAAVAGAIHAQTGSGDVEIRQTQRGEVAVQTGSGDVTISLPSEAAFTLDARTGSGSISTAQTISMQGRLGRNHVQGTVRGGGDNVRIRTGSGSIDIR